MAESDSDKVVAVGLEKSGNRNSRSSVEGGVESDFDENKTIEDNSEECEVETDDTSEYSFINPVANPFANLETIFGRLQEDEKTKKFVNDPSFLEMLEDLGKNPLNISKYLKDDRLRLTLSALLGFELEHPDKMNFNEPPFNSDGDEKSSEAKKFKDLGTACLRKKEYAKAIDYYDKAIELDATDISFYSNKALAFDFQGQRHDVRDTSFTLVDVWTEHGGDGKIAAKAYKRIGQSFVEENEFHEALRYFEQSFELHELDVTKKLADECREKIKLETNQ